MNRLDCLDEGLPYARSPEHDPGIHPYRAAAVTRADASGGANLCSPAWRAWEGDGEQTFVTDTDLEKAYFDDFDNAWIY